MKNKRSIILLFTLFFILILCSCTNNPLDGSSELSESYINASLPQIEPSDVPTDFPSIELPDLPTISSSEEPSDVPSEEPSDVPSEELSVPSEEPSVPSEGPSEISSQIPSEEPSDVPSEELSVPSEEPSVPSEEPSVPSEEPSVPSEEPSDVPSEEPSVPSEGPSEISSQIPSEETPSEVVGYKASVSVIYNKKEFDLTGTEVILMNDYEYKYGIFEGNVAYFDTLRGEYQVIIDTIDKFSYNPNAYVISEDSNHITIDLSQITSFRRNQGTGKGLYEAYQITDVGTFRFEAANDEIVYYEFAPLESGVYVIESHISKYSSIGSKLNIHPGTKEYKHEEPTEIIIDGGVDTLMYSNFRYEFTMYQEMIGSIWTFGIETVGKYDSEIVIDFTISKIRELPIKPSVVDILANDTRLSGVTPDYDPNEYVFMNSDGGTGNYCGSYKTNGSGVLDITDYIFNEDDQYWHYNTIDGPILCAYIASSCPYYETSFINIESHGNKNLTVSSGTENYKEFIEVSYANFCNSDGICYVTPELMEFLQKYCVSQRLYIDGEGWVETFGVTASEDSQWLFACGYYMPIS